MSLLFKEDWEETKERYKAWWAGENFGRCGLAVTAPRAKPIPVPKPPDPKTPEERWMDLDYISAATDYAHSRRFFGGEAFPTWGIGYPGHQTLAAFLGCPTVLQMGTAWSEPILSEQEKIDYQTLQLDENNPYLQFHLKWLGRAAEDSKGKSIPPVGAFGGCGDTLSHLRGNERLLFDLVERPQQVREAALRLMDIWFDVYNRAYSILNESAQGSTCWFSLWSPGKFYATQNDFAYMISPTMFRDIFLPTVDKNARFLDHSVHHVDGIGNFNHVDALCELPALGALQILPGAGKPSPLHYMDVLKKVQRAKKNLHISIPANEVEAALRELSARGLFIQTYVRTEEQAHALLKNAEKWSRDRC